MMFKKLFLNQNAISTVSFEKGAVFTSSYTEDRKHKNSNKFSIFIALIFAFAFSQPVFASVNEKAELIQIIKNNPTSLAELKEFSPSAISKDPQQYIHVLEKIIFFWGDPAQHVDAQLLRNLLPPADREKVERMYKEGKFGFTKESEELLRHRYPRSLGIGMRLGLDSYNHFRAHNPAPIGMRYKMTHTIKGFPLEALIFYAAIGASMWTKDLAPTFATFNPNVQNGREDPRWVDNWVHEFTSPIGIFSFLAFVMVSQATQHVYTKGTSRIAMRSLKSRLTEIIHKDGTKTWRYELPRSPSHKTMKFFGLLGGQLGMALGMTASNIIHEFWNFVTINPSFKQCWDKDMRLLNNQQSALACDMAFEEGVRTAWSWAPMIGSMLTASIISGQLVSRTIMSYKARKAFRRLSHLVFGWNPAGRVGKVLLNTPIAQWFSRNNIFPRLVHLWAFMETDQRLTRPLFDKYVTEGMKARQVVRGLGPVTYKVWGAFDKGWGVKGGMANFIKYHDVDYSTPALSCEETTEEEECQYHPSILSMHKTASVFDQWRSFKMQMAQMAHQNWISHVSNTLGLFDLSKDFYKDLFEAKENQSSKLNQVSYFGNKVHESQALVVIQKMRNMITDYIGDRDSHAYKDNPLPSEGLISLSPSRFLKTKDQLRKIVPQGEGTQDLLILRSLFDVVDLNIAQESSVQEPSELDKDLNTWDQALKPLYGSAWEKAKAMETKRITKQTEQTLAEEMEWFKQYQKKLSIEQYFVDLNKLIQTTKATAKEQKEKGKGYETQTFNISIIDEYGEIVEQKIENCAMVLCGFSAELEKQVEQYVQQKVTDLKAILSAESPEELFTQQQQAELALTDHYQRILSTINAQKRSIINFHNTEHSLSSDYNLNTLFDNWLSFVKEEKDTFFAHAGAVIKKWETKRMEIATAMFESLKQNLLIATAIEVRKHLRDKALAAGLEYLHHIVHQKTAQNSKLRGHLASVVLTEKEKEYRKTVSRLLALIEKTKTGTSSLTEQEQEELGLLSVIVRAEDKERIAYIAELKEKQAKGQSVNSRLIKKQEEQLKQTSMPAEVHKVFYFLGDDIWAQLYEYGAQLKPLSEGMNTIVGINNRVEKIEEAYREDYHPKSINSLKTKGVMDFLLVSTLCGPSLETLSLETNKNMTPETYATSFDQGSNNISIADYSQQLEEDFEERRKKLVLKDEDKSIMEKAEDILNEDIPVFERAMSGQDFAFHPPRMTNMNEEDRQAICSHYQTVDNIYDSPFKVRDKEYTSLLQVAKDHIGNPSISSSSDFDHWWENNVSAYQNIFKQTADLEHHYVVQDRFIKSFFQNDINTSATLTSATLQSEWAYDLRQTESQVLDNTPESCLSPKEQNSRFVSVWDKMACFSKKWFSYNGDKVERPVPSIGIVPRNKQHYGSVNSSSQEKEYELNLPKGFFHNVYFEAHFWADVILHFAKKRKKHWMELGWSWDSADDPFMNQNKLESGLQNLIHQFKVDPACLSSEEEMEQANKIIACKKWSQDYIARGGALTNMIFERGWDSIEKSQKEILCDDSSEAPSSLEHFWQILCQDVAGDGLNMDMISIVHGSQQQLEGSNKYAYLENNLNKLAFFTKNSDRPDGIERPEVAPLPDQIINYALLRLYQLREQAHMQALTVVRYISEHPDFKARQLHYHLLSAMNP